MGVKSAIIQPFAKRVLRQTLAWAAQPEATQQRQLQQLLRVGPRTAFGQAHKLDQVRTYEEWKSAVPLGDYESMRPYIDRIKAGELNVLWRGRPSYFAKTSGTTSGVKYIPITRDSIGNHITGARNAALHYMASTGRSQFFDNRIIFLSGSPSLDTSGVVPTGRLSGIVNHHVPAWLRRNQMPTLATNMIEDWEAKLDRIVDETLHARMGLISGIPPWVQMYFDKVMARTGKTVGQVWPHFQLFMYGGVNFEPYRKKLLESIGRPIDSVELYPASEGFFAYQDVQGDPGMLLQLNSGIFYEFIPMEDLQKPDPRRYSIGQVEVGRHYAIVINSNAGLWGYVIGDTVKFTSLNPVRLVVSGRTKHFISAFGEHVIQEEVEQAMQLAMRAHPEVHLVEFTVAPQVTPAEGLPHHEWLVEFATPPADLGAFAAELDRHMRKLNTYYDDLITGHVLQPLRLRLLQPAAFREYMRSQGRLGGQNKVPRLGNDRILADRLAEYVV